MHEEKASSRHASYNFYNDKKRFSFIPKTSLFSVVLSSNRDNDQRVLKLIGRNAESTTTSLFDKVMNS